jgi:hypothetical protein
LASPSQYVVQITLGSNSWLTGTALGYDPQVGHLGTDAFQPMNSFQDEYIQNTGTSTLTADTVSSPTVVYKNGGSLGFDTTRITSLSTFDDLNADTWATPFNTYDILSPSGSGTSFSDSRDCGSW